MAPARNTLAWHKARLAELESMHGLILQARDFGRLEELAHQALTLAEEDTPWWRFLLTMLEALADDTVQALADPANGQFAEFNRGRLAMLFDLRNRILAARQRARSPVTE